MPYKNKEKTLMWKILVILFLLFAVVIWFKGEHDKKEIIEKYSDCAFKKDVCNEVLNLTLIEWKKCIFAVGGLMNMTDEEIEYKLEDSTPFYLNDSGGKK